MSGFELSVESKAKVLAEALGWLKRFHGCTVVVKFGGNAMINDELKRSFAEDIVFLHLAGIRTVVVHGGGPQINTTLTALGIESEFQAGHRVTTPEVLEVVRMVLTGKVQRDIVSLINQHGPFAVGISGEDAALLTAKKRETMVDGMAVDLGFVGDITDVRPDLITTLLADGLIPVLSSVGVGIDGTVYNVNADAAAGAVAAALGADKVVFLTDVGGLYANWPDSDDVISSLTATELRAMLPTLSTGMIPKMEACLTAVAGGVAGVHVIDGRRAHSMLLEVFTDDGIGTMVTADPVGRN